MTEPLAGHDGGRHCQCVAEHRPAPLELNRHHILPLEHGGPDVAGNIAWLCPTAHVNVHELLRLIIARGGRLPWAEALELYPQQLNRYAYALAHEGWTRMQASRG
jgi:hypothetical protein